MRDTLQVSLIEIRQKELDFYTRNCISIGTQAALLSGFAYAGIIQIAIPESCPDSLKAAYLSMTVATMTLHLIALVRAAPRRSPCLHTLPHYLLGVAALAGLRLAFGVSVVAGASAAYGCLLAPRLFSILRPSLLRLSAVQLDDVRDARAWPCAARPRRLDAHGSGGHDGGVQGMLPLLRRRCGRSRAP